MILINNLLENMDCMPTISSDELSKTDPRRTGLHLPNVPTTNVPRIPRKEYIYTFFFFYIADMSFSNTFSSTNE